jgi:general secretion pathway protein I
MASRSRPCRRHRSACRVTGQGGFTLLEVLVALTIVAVALGAIIRTSGQSTGNLVYVRDKIVAAWVAENRIAEAMLAQQWPATGTSEGIEEMVGQEWSWEVTVSATADPDLRRLDVRVRPEGTEDGSLVTVSAFRGKGRQP